MKKLIVLTAVFLFAALGCSQNSKKPGEGSKEVVQSQPRQMAAPSPVTHNHIDEKLLEIYSGVELEIRDTHTGKASKQIIPFNTATKLEGTPLTAEVTLFYPDFYMTEQGYGTKTTEPNNIAAKLKITGSTPEFDGWLFVSFPDVHPYENPNYSIILVNAVKK